GQGAGGLLRAPAGGRRRSPGHPLLRLSPEPAAPPGGGLPALRARPPAAAAARRRPEDRSMNGKQAIFITGAASGIGRETALLFARRGWRIGAFDLDEAGLDRLREEIGDDLCLTGRLDVRDAAAYREQVAAF